MKISPQSVVGSDIRKSKVSLIQTNLDSYSNDSLLAQKTINQIVALPDSAVRTAQPDLLILPEAALPIPLFKILPFLILLKSHYSLANLRSNWLCGIS